MGGKSVVAWGLGELGDLQQRGLMDILGVREMFYVLIVWLHRVYILVKVRQTVYLKRRLYFLLLHVYVVPIVSNDHYLLLTICCTIF